MSRGSLVDSMGKSTEWTQLKQQIRASMAYGQNVLHGHTFRFVSKHPPAINHRDYCHQWSEFLTSIPYKPGNKAGDKSRLQNIQLAVNCLNGLLLKPQQILSFWHHVPRPTLKNGFREGPAFIRGLVTKDVGGGLCLVSTNLFNVLLLGNCEILERHNHSIDPYGERRFFPLGRDATVYYGYKDLMIRNPYDVSLLLKMKIAQQGKAVQASLWGLQPSPVMVRIESTYTEKHTAPTPQGMPGYQAMMSRFVCEQHLSMEEGAWQKNYSVSSHYHPCSYSYY